MAVAWLIEKLQAVPPTSHTDTEKARTLVLHPYLEVVGRTRIMEISLEPAPYASNKLYRYHYTVSCEFPTFPNTIDNQLLPLFVFH